MRSKNPLVYLFSKTWQYSLGSRHNIVTFWTLFSFAEVNDLFFKPILFAMIMNIVQAEGVTEGNIHQLVFLTSMTLVSTLVFWLFHGPARVLEQINSFRARVNYRKYLLQGVMNLKMEWHTENHSGDTIDKIEKGTNGLYTFSQDTFSIIYSIVNMIVSYGILVYFSRPAAYIVLIMLSISIWITMRFDKVLIGQYKELNKAENKISESTFDAISNITTVIILRVERLVFQTLSHKIDQPFDLYKKNVKLSETKWFLTNVCSTVMRVLVMVVYFWQNIGTEQGVLVGNVYLLTNYLGEIGEVFFRFTSMYSNIVKNKARVMNSEELSEEFSTESFANHVLPSRWQNISIANMTFSYNADGDGDPHLYDIALSIRRGERIAFVGESGSGKTTLLKIMRDLYHPASVELTVDGDVVEGGFSGISRAISLVPQNPEIFTTSIIENITLGAEYDLDFVRRFTDMACFSDVVDNLPHGFASSIKEKGVNLSGGQQQRLALSRGLLACHDKDIVLLDEPTSSLDTPTEMAVYQNIFREFVGKTVISSVHRLHLLPLFEKIYFFSGGRIIASGSLNNLLLSSPDFREVWSEYHKDTDI